jgi:hypothetical protein
VKAPIPRKDWKIFDRLPRKDRPPFSEVAAVQTFKLMGWATATGGLYLLQERSGSFGLKVIPYLLFFLIIWDMSAKLGWEPEVERTDDALYVILDWKYLFKFLWVSALSVYTAWATIFWIAPLIHEHGLSKL